MSNMTSFQTIYGKRLEWERKEEKEIIWHLQLVIQVIPLLSLILTLLHDFTKTHIENKATKCK